jgi:hypothetical protein
MTLLLSSVIPRRDRGIGTKHIISSWQIKEISIKVFGHHDHPERNMKPWEMVDRCKRRTLEGWGQKKTPHRARGVFEYIDPAYRPS